MFAALELSFALSFLLLPLSRHVAAVTIRPKVSPKIRDVECSPQARQARDRNDDTARKWRQNGKKQTDLPDRKQTGLPGTPWLQHARSFSLTSDRATSE